MESGLIIWEAAKISYLQKLYESKKKNTRHLLRYFADVNEWGEWVSENRRQYLCEMEKSNLRPQDVKNYYMEYDPCILRMLTEELLSRHLLPGEAEKSMLIGLWKMRKNQMDQERGSPHLHKGRTGIFRKNRRPCGNSGTALQAGHDSGADCTFGELPGMDEGAGLRYLYDR